MDGSGAALGAPAFIHLKAGIRSRDLASEIQETFQPTLSECESGRNEPLAGR